MIVIITYKEKNKRTGKEEIFVSHGVDENLKNIVLPQVPIAEIGATFDEEIGEYVLK